MRVPSLVVRAWLAASVLISLAACGGKVFLDETSALGGAGGQTPASACAHFCEVSAAHNCGTPPDCAASCESGIGQLGLCEAEYSAIFQCAADTLVSTGKCDPSANACTSEVAAFTICVSNSTTGPGFGGAGGGL